METIKFANYGEKRERIATESELEIYDLLCNMTGRDDFDLVRKSDNYVATGTSHGSSLHRGRNGNYSQ